MATHNTVQHNILSLFVYAHLYLLFACTVKAVCMSLCSVRTCTYRGVFFFLHASIEI